jgi:hypothetical protein
VDVRSRSKVSPSVVLLRALIPHHFNYIRIHHHERVNEALRRSLRGFIEWDEGVLSMLGIPH